MSIEFWRDLSITIVGLETALLVLAAIVLVIVLYIFLSRALRAVRKGTMKVRGFSRRAALGTSRPLIAVAAFLMSFRETLKAAIVSLRQHRERAPRRENTASTGKTSKKTTTMGIGLGALLGILGGLAIGFMYTPRSGKDIRKSASVKARQVTRKTEAIIGRSRATLNWLRRGRKPVMAEGHR